MKILITGGCGFLGSNLACSFLKNGAEVCIIDSLERNGSQENLQWLKSISLRSQLHFMKSDISKFEGINFSWLIDGFLR